MSSFAQPSAQAPDTASKRTYWKTGLGFVAAFAAIGTCLFYPPAALFISPVVELLAASLPAAFGVYAGLAAFGLTVAGIGLGAMGVMGVLCGCIDALFFRKKADSVKSYNAASTSAPEAVQQQAAGQPDESRGKVMSSPLTSSESLRASGEDLAQEEEADSSHEEYHQHTRSHSH